MSLKEITTTATSGNIAGLPPNEPPISKKKQKKITGKLSKKKWWEKWLELSSKKYGRTTISSTIF